MLRYLVTSKTRRRLLLLLWGSDARGSAGELAERAGVSLASAQAELKAMQHAQLVNVVHEGNRDVYVANFDHPAAPTLRALVASELAPAAVHRYAGDDTVRSKLRALGAPLRGVSPLAVDPSEVPEVLLGGVRLARRDPVVARTLPLCFWSVRNDLDPKQLSALAMGADDKHALGFFLELTSQLGGDRRLLGMAEWLRDRRMTSTRSFFQTDAAARGPSRSFPLAEKWGFSMNADLDTFRSLFDKFVK
jgi:hypothetical protein